MDLSAYLERIQLPLAPEADAGGLLALQRAHRMTIPFENLDILFGRGISLDPDAVFDKLVRRRRGGYCFEHGQLFLRALAATGFEAHPLLARVWLFATDVPPKTHTLARVVIDGATWIADAGFGGAYTPPMLLEDGAEAETPDGAAHRLVRDTDHGWMLYRRAGADADWAAQYSFTTDRAFDADLALSNHWVATAPDSRFVHQPIVSIVLPTGFAALTGRAYTRSTAREKTAAEITSAKVARMRLSLMFGIDLTADEVTALGFDG